MLTLKHENEAEVKIVTCTLTAATANVATMPFYQRKGGCMSSKANDLAHQFLEAGYDIVAFQETRAAVSGTKYLGPWLRIISASCEGNGGVEIWVETTN